MPAWHKLIALFEQADRRPEWLAKQIGDCFAKVSEILSGNVLLYFSAYMQKPGVANATIIDEDINGIMNALHGMDYQEPLTVIMHTPGGKAGAVESLTEYIHSKHKEVTAVIPCTAMSGGTMFALSCDKIIISRAGQLGPIDSQIHVRGHPYSVLDIIQQFERIKKSRRLQFGIQY